MIIFNADLHLPLDYEIECKFCYRCTQMKARLSNKEYVEWVKMIGTFNKHLTKWSMLVILVIYKYKYVHGDHKSFYNVCALYDKKVVG